MSSDIIVEGTDEKGCEHYERLYRDIMSDLDEIASTELSYLYLKPEEPLFIMSVRLKGAPEAKTLDDVASVRFEGETAHIAVTDEFFAPGVISALWGKYGKDNVVQTDRFTVSVTGPESAEEVGSLPVETKEDPVQDVIGALWRVMPEGIRNRRVYSNGNVVTIVATEELTSISHLKAAEEIHRKMIAGEIKDV